MKDVNKRKIDIEIHKLISKLLTESEFIEKDESLTRNQQTINHENQILAVQAAIKPGIFALYFQPYTKEMIK